MRDKFPKMGSKCPTSDRRVSLRSDSPTPYENAAAPCPTPRGLWSRPAESIVDDPVCLPQPLYPRVIGETPPYRSVRALYGLRQTPEPGIRTVIDLLRRSAEKYSCCPAVASRETIAIHKRNLGPGADGTFKTLNVAELTEYAYTTYAEYEKLITDLGSGLANFGLKAGKDKLCIWAATCVDWLAIFHGAASQSIPIVTAYSSLGLSGIQRALTSTKASGIFVDAQGLERIDAVLEAAPLLRVVVYGNDADISQGTSAELGAKFPNVRFVHLRELQASGNASSTKRTDPQAEDLCAIFYTSGSTGDPKGVPLKHKHVVATVAGWDHVLGRHLGNNDRYLSYLPLAHIMEFGLAHLLFHRGVCIGYGSPRTLFDSNVHACKGDFRELRPTCTVGVPAIWESVRKAILSMLATLPSAEQTRFWQAFKEVKTSAYRGPPTPVEIDARFTQAREMLGGKLRFALTGGGPIAADTQEFISHVIAPLCGGFGMTETVAIAGITDPADWRNGFGSLGSVPDCAELKLVDEPAAGYLTSNHPPEGEIWIRSYSATDHYYDDNVETAKAFTEDGWFKTGDIGRIDARGVISVIDRKKNLVKTLNGEYIALEKVEAIYRSCKTVVNVCVHADSRRKKPIAIVLPNKQAMTALLEAQKHATDTLPTAKDDITMQRLVLQQLQNRARERDLASIETVEGVVLSRLEEWSTANGTMSAVGKLVRRGILTAHKDEIDQLLAALEPI